MTPITGAVLHSLRARGIRAGLDLDYGQIAFLVIEREGREIAPFARVPWADSVDPDRVREELPPHLRRMSGDFFCAPFGLDDVEGAPLHGWPGNARWDLVEETPLGDGIRARFRLSRKIAGATVEKIWVLRDDHPCLYQRHDFIGGSGAIPMAHHAMIDVRTGAVLRFSPKLRAETFETPHEPGHGAISYPAASADLTRFPAPGGTVDLTRVPFARRHEDFAMLIDDPQVGIGWATALRPAFADLAFLVKNVAQLPQTMLWMSNGGRDYAPWNGQHVGVVGIEEARAFGGRGWSASTAPNRLSEEGIPTAFDLSANPVTSVATAMGAVPCTDSDGVTAEITGDRILFSDGTQAPFDGTWVQ